MGHFFEENPGSSQRNLTHTAFNNLGDKGNITEIKESRQPMKPKPIALILFLVGFAGNAWVFINSGNFDLNEPGHFSTFNMLYYLMIVPIIITFVLIAAVTKHEYRLVNSQFIRAKIYLISALFGLSLTLYSTWTIKTVKEDAGINFQSSAKERMEKYRTDLFKGRLKKFVDPNPKTSHIPYAEQVRKANEGAWEDEDGADLDE